MNSATNITDGVIKSTGLQTTLPAQPVSQVVCRRAALRGNVSRMPGAHSQWRATQWSVAHRALAIAGPDGLFVVACDTRQIMARRAEMKSRQVLTQFFPDEILRASRPAKSGHPLAGMQA